MQLPAEASSVRLCGDEVHCLIQHLSCLDEVTHFLVALHLVADPAAHVLLLGEVLDVGVVEGVLNLLNGPLHMQRWSGREVSVFDAILRLNGVGVGSNLTFLMDPY